MLRKLGATMTRGEVWLADVGGKTRPVLILTRPEVIDVRQLVTVAEITTTMRGLAAEVAIDHTRVGLDHASAINCDGLQTIRRSSLTHRIGITPDATWAMCAGPSDTRWAADDEDEAPSGSADEGIPGICHKGFVVSSVLDTRTARDEPWRT